MLTVNVAVFLAVVVIILLRRPPAPRSRVNGVFTGLAILAFGVVIAPTQVGQSILRVLGQIAGSISHASL